MAFTIENGNQNRMSFLNIEIIREDKTLTTFAYRKPTFSGVYTHLLIYTPLLQKNPILSWKALQAS